MVFNVFSYKKNTATLPCIILQTPTHPLQIIPSQPANKMFSNGKTGGEGDQQKQKTLPP